MSDDNTFRTGPYDVLKYSIREKDGVYFVEINGGDLGSLRIEDRESVQKLRGMLNNIEEEMKERDRQKEEL